MAVQEQLGKVAAAETGVPRILKLGLCQEAARAPRCFLHTKAGLRRMSAGRLWIM